MSKGIIVVEIPKKCADCSIELYDDGLYIDGFRCMGMDQELSTEEYRRSGKPDWCPIRPMPEKAFHEDYCDNGRYDKGWNDCLREIGGIDNDLE